MAGATHANTQKNITAENLRNIWHIDHDTEHRTLDITSQNCGRVDNL